MKTEPVTVRLNVKQLAVLCKYFHKHKIHIRSRNHLLSMAVEALERSILAHDHSLRVGTVEEAYSLLSELGFTKNMKPSVVDFHLKLEAAMPSDPIAAMLAVMEEGTAVQTLDGMLIKGENEK